MGPYRSNDLVVIDQHTEWLRNVGVDFLVFDWSNNCGNALGDRNQNGNLWAIEDNTMEFAKRQWTRKQNGQSFIKIAIMLGTCGDCSNVNNGILNAMASKVQNQYIKDPSLSQIYYQIYNKPLLSIFCLGCEQQTSSFQFGNFHMYIFS